MLLAIHMSGNKDESQNMSVPKRNKHIVETNLIPYLQVYKCNYVHTIILKRGTISFLLIFANDVLMLSLLEVLLVTLLLLLLVLVILVWMHCACYRCGTCT